MRYYRCQFSSLQVLFALTLVFSCSFSLVFNTQFDNLRNMSVPELKALVRAWYRYYTILEQRGLTTENDRRQMEQLLRMIAPMMRTRSLKRTTSTHLRLPHISSTTKTE
ncbi:uncharacterized protein LOC134686134 [Mytilus trossulus]|uniref:uncharacterized protein LOC134686134 n=1 Tax=Mytilus trossulus TaxID=6551 RepID=UPI0030043463